MNRTKAYRRSQYFIHKKKAYKKLIIDNIDLIEQNKFEPSERLIGKMESTHSCSCSCEMCGNPRKHFNEKTLRERKSDDKFKTELNDD